MRRLESSFSKWRLERSAHQVLLVALWGAGLPLEKIALVPIIVMQRWCGGFLLFGRTPRPPSLRPIVVLMEALV